MRRSYRGYRYDVYSRMRDAIVLEDVTSHEVEDFLETRTPASQLAESEWVKRGQYKVIKKPGEPSKDAATKKERDLKQWAKDWDFVRFTLNPKAKRG